MNIYIETLGCPKNVNDSEVFAGILTDAGYRIGDDLYTADVVIVNTCGFIGDAKKESIDTIFELAQTKRDEALLIVTGCLSQRYGNELFKQMPEVDIFLGVNDYPRLPEILEKYAGSREKHFSPCPEKYVEIPHRKHGAPYTATLKIAEGCDNICTYCVIPSIRGGYRSRKKEDVLAEAKQLGRQGCKELILIAQDVTAYGMDLYGEFALAGLLRELCAIEEIQWIRLMYCYEDRITDELIQVMAEEPKICKYIDIPLQHCSDTVLQAMNRRSTRTSIENTIRRLRTAIPEIHIRTTFIVGFPGEKKKDFEELLDFVESMKFERLGVFSYSKEEGTPAYGMTSQVRPKLKEIRRNLLMIHQLAVSYKKNEEKIGNVLEVIVEGKDAEGAYFGRTRYDAPEIDNSVIFTSYKDLRIGDIINVKILDAFDYDLTGEEVLPNEFT